MMIWNSMNFNFPSNSSMETICLLMDYTMMFLTFVTVFVFLMMISVVINKNIDNSILINHEIELIWSLIPFIILLMICFPTLKSLYCLESCDFKGMSLKVMGFQWYWVYSYNFTDKWSLTSYMSPLEFNLRLLEADNSVLIPFMTPLNFLISSNDVIHSWTIPSMGVKADAIPGRINQLNFSAKKLGKFFGQCSEICGANHSFMPISIEVLEAKNFIKLI